MIRFPSLHFLGNSHLPRHSVIPVTPRIVAPINLPSPELDPAPPVPRPTFKMAQDLTVQAIDKLAARKKELEATIATASAELAHTASTLEALGQARQSFREGNTVATAQSIGRALRPLPDVPKPPDFGTGK
jgi:hypothetical protein